MHDTMPEGMAEALRLTRAGKLAEATAIIRRSLGGPPARTTSTDQPADAAEPLEGTFRVVCEQPPPADAPAIGMAERSGSGATAEREWPEFASASDTSERAHSAVQTKGRFVDGSFTNAAGTRTYRLYVPGGYTGQAVPLIVMLHGCTQTAADFAAGTRLNELAEEETFLVVYPEQAAAANPSRCWNWFKSSNQRRDGGEPSLIAGITRRITDEYRADSLRVYVAGMSAGGAMAAIMGVTYPDLYAGVGIHSGLAYGAARDLNSALAAMRKGRPDPVRAGDLSSAGSVPTIVFHGDRDTTVHPRNGEQALAQALPRSPGHAHGTAHDADLSVSAGSGQVPGGHAYTRSIYRNVLGRIVGEQWVIHGAGHAWSGGSTAGSFTDPRGPDASKEMLRFFREHPAADTAVRPSG